MVLARFFGGFLGETPLEFGKKLKFGGQCVMIISVQDCPEDHYRKMATIQDENY